MRALKKATCLFTIAALLLPGMAHAASKWLRADTHNFIIYSDGGEKDLREFAENVERFDATLRKFMQIGSREKPNRLTIYMVRDQATVGRIVRDSNVAGFYRPGLEGSFAVANRSQSTQLAALTGTEVLFHEYAHHFMFENLSAAYPLWLQEGVAEYYSTVTFTKEGQPVVGTPAYHRALGLFYGTKVPLKSVLTARRYSDVKKSQQETFYGRSWLLTHKLMRSPEGLTRLRNYLTDFFNGMPLEDAANRHFDIAATEKELDAAMTGRFTKTTLLEPVAFQSEMTVLPLDALHSELIGLRLQFIGRANPVAARDRLTALAAQYPDQSDVWYELANAIVYADMDEQRKAAKALRDGKNGASQPADNDDEDSPLDQLQDVGLFGTLAPVREPARLAAEAALDKAITANKANGRARALLANLIMTRLDEASTPVDDKAWAAVRTHVIAANSANPEDPVPLVMWYRVQQETKGKPSETARAGLAKAFELVPEVIPVRIMYAFDLARNGNIPTARKILEIIANDAHSGNAGQLALQQLDAMEGKTATTPPDSTAKPAPPAN